LRTDLEAVPTRKFQERLLYDGDATNDLIDNAADLQQVVSGLPKAKREWLAYVGLYPIQPAVADALSILIADPEHFRAAVVQSLRRSIESCSFVEFIRHTLLPIECDEKKKVLRASRKCRGESNP
jgi:hypothetical protein